MKQGRPSALHERLCFCSPTGHADGVSDPCPWRLETETFGRAACMSRSPQRPHHQGPLSSRSLSSSARGVNGRVRLAGPSDASEAKQSNGSCAKWKRSTTAVVVVGAERASERVQQDQTSEGRKNCFGGDAAGCAGWCAGQQQVVSIGKQASRAAGCWLLLLDCSPFGTAAWHRGWTSRAASQRAAAGVPGPQPLSQKATTSREANIATPKIARGAFLLAASLHLSRTGTVTRLARGRPNDRRRCLCAVTWHARRRRRAVCCLQLLASVLLLQQRSQPKASTTTGPSAALPPAPLALHC